MTSTSSIEQGVEFIIKNSLVEDNMLVLSASDVGLLQASTTLLYSPATQSDFEDYSLNGWDYLGQVTLEDYDARVLVFTKNV